MLTIVKTFDWLPLTILLVLYQYVRATSVMSDQVALWSDKVQTAIKKLFSSQCDYSYKGMLNKPIALTACA